MDVSNSTVREQRVRNTPPANPQEKSSQCCRHYLRKKCKYGKKGDNCKYSHPKICSLFETSGKIGCAKGKKCEQYHPYLCRNSLKQQFCDIQDCKFFHLKSLRNKNIAKSDGDSVKSDGDSAKVDGDSVSAKQEGSKQKSEVFQKGESKDPDLRALITNLTKTVMELVEENKARKEQEALWYNPWGYQAQYQAQ